MKPHEMVNVQEGMAWEGGRPRPPQRKTLPQTKFTTSRSWLLCTMSSEKNRMRSGRLVIVARIVEKAGGDARPPI